MFVKLGYSRNPESRLRYQLGLREDVEAELIDEVPVPSGQVALRMERALHRQLKAEHPEKVIPRDELAAWINVTSEVYTAEAEPIIRACSTRSRARSGRARTRPRPRAKTETKRPSHRRSPHSQLSYPAPHLGAGRPIIAS